MLNVRDPTFHGLVPDVISWRFWDTIRDEIFIKSVWPFIAAVLVVVAVYDIYSRGRASAAAHRKWFVFAVPALSILGTIALRPYGLPPFVLLFFLFLSGFMIYAMVMRGPEKIRRVVPVPVCFAMGILLTGLVYAGYFIEPLPCSFKNLPYSIPGGMRPEKFEKCSASDPNHP